MSVVTVCLKLPNGLKAQVENKVITFNGWNSNLILGAEYGITEDVPKDFWETWLKENQWQKLVKNGLIFAQEKQKDLKAQIKDTASLKSGAEQLDPNTMGKDNGK